MDARPEAKSSFFDVWSSFYDLAPVQRLTYRPVQDAVVEELRAVPAPRVLDLGCGTGLLTARLQHDRVAERVVGLDFSAGMLSKARARAPGIDWVQASACALPLRDATFDAITSTEAFHWFPDQSRALAECARVLVPGGRLLVALVNVPAEIVSDVVHAASSAVGQPFYWPTRARMREMLEGAGLRVLKQRRLFRIPAALMLPPVLTIATKPSLQR